MIISAATKTTIDATFNALSATIQAQIRNTSVKLFGKTHKSSDFTGSGVILYANGNETWILTAKHNLYVYAEKADPPPWDDSLETQFKTGVKIYYDDNMAWNKDPSQNAAITSIDVIRHDNEKTVWDYDVMILKSTDADLNAFAANNHVPDQADAGYVFNPKQYLNRAKQVFIQTGYGDVTEKADDEKKPICQQTNPVAISKGIFNTASPVPTPPPWPPYTSKNWFKNSIRPFSM